MARMFPDHTHTMFKRTSSVVLQGNWREPESLHVSAADARQLRMGCGASMRTCISASLDSSCSRTTRADTRLLRRPDACTAEDLSQRRSGVQARGTLTLHRVHKGSDGEHGRCTREEG